MIIANKFFIKKEDKKKEEVENSAEDSDEIYEDEYCFYLENLIEDLLLDSTEHS